MRILFVGDSPTVGTGFGVVSKNILKELQKYGHDISVLGVNFFGDPYDTKEFPYQIFPCDKGNIDLLYGYAKLWYVAKKIKPDLLFFLNDPWVIQKYLDYRPSDIPYMKYLGYYPTDSAPLKPEWVKMLNTEMDVQVCYSNFAERVVTESNEGVRPKNLYQVYHGVDTKTFYPINQQVARTELGIPLDSFVVGMVARNQYRKRFDILTKGFAKFAEDKPNVKLYLHTALQDVGFDIVDLARQFNLNEKLILTEDVTTGQGVPEHVLNLIYNSFDVNALISLGDGFGLPVAESMATACPQLVSDHSCLKELVEGHGGLTVRNAAWMLNANGINTWGGVSDEADIARKLDRLYYNKEERIKLSEDAYNFIHQDKFKWEVIGKQFNQIIKDMFHIL
jgi:glycosyltransferase involved in cell wall biosynthesis